MHARWIRLLNGLVLSGAILAMAAQARAQITTTNLFAHYDAALGITYSADPQVDQWADQATANGDQYGDAGSSAANAIKPMLVANAINGLPSIHQETTTGGAQLIGFAVTDSANTPFGTDLTNLSALTYTLVCKTDQPNTTQYLLSFNTDGTGSDDNFIGTRYENGNRITFVYDGAGFQTISNDAGIVGTDWVVLSVVWDRVAGTLKEYVNGSLTGSNSSAGNSSTDLSVPMFRTGTDTSRNNRFKGDYAELLVYNAALSDADRQATEQFLLAKYQLQHPGDANGDGMVNLADLQILGDNWQSTTATWSQADFTGDGNVNLADLQILGDNWGFGTTPDVSFDEALNSVVIPEPAGLSALACGVLLIAGRRGQH